MGTFKEQEKQRQAEFKAESADYTNEAKNYGVYRGKPRHFCLPLEKADENLFFDIRKQVKDYFCHKNIKWHDGNNGNPSNHLCSGQVFCVNFLFPFAKDREAVAGLLKTVYPFPGVKRVLPIEMEYPGQFISFEWIGLENYLCERIGKSGMRFRGALFTSADAAIRFEREDSKIQIVLIEWKYTESYSDKWLGTAESGTDRRQIYAHLYSRDDCPLNKKILPCYDDLFYEPFYQLMRQQLLANEMEKAHELRADIVSVLHISPKHNEDFKKVTSQNLKHLGKSPVEIWKRVVTNPDRFTSISVEELFMGFPISQFPELRTWHDYISQRYSWIAE